MIVSTAAIAGVVIVGVTVLLGVCWRLVVFNPRDLRLTTIDAPIAGLPRAFDGYRIAILSDLHHGPQQPATLLARAVAFANSQAPHLVALLGDYGTSEWAMPRLSLRWYRRSFSAIAPHLRALRAQDGVVAVIGNHDHYASAEETAAWLRGLGVRVLRDEAIMLAAGDDRLRLAGIADAEEGDLTVDGVAELLAGGDHPTIVLSHHPDGVRFCGHPSVRLVLSGHTHGGQVVLPVLGALVTRSEVCTRTHAAGWIPNPFAPLFVTRGVGYQLPVRVGAPPEVVVLTLRPAAS